MSRELISFRSKNTWLKEEGLKNLLKNWCGSFSVRGFLNFFMTAKLKALKAILRRQNKDTFDNVSLNNDLTLNQVDFWDAEKET